MRNRILCLSAAGLVIIIAMILAGCSTEDPWTVNPNQPVILSLISGPADTVANGAAVTFVWATTGGSGTITYQYRLNGGSWVDLGNSTSYTFETLAGPQDYTFDVLAADAAGSSDTVTAPFIMRGSAPVIQFTRAPGEGSFVAAGSILTFGWDASDPDYGTDLLYQYSFTGVTSEWIPSTSVSFENVVAADPATFTVIAKNPAEITTTLTVSFIIKDADILYVDDFLWVDGFGRTMPATERSEKAFYRAALEGYAFAEWDIALQGIPTNDDLVDPSNNQPRYSTIVFCSDSQLGTTSGTWVTIGQAGGSIRYYLDNGGNLLLAGALALLDMGDYGSNGPTPLPGDFEYDWLGLDSTAWCYDYWDDFTWVVKEPATTLSLPDSMKIDVGKNGDQVDYAIKTPGLRNDASVFTEVIYKWGLDINGESPAAYDHPIAHITSRIAGADTTARTALLNFDTYSMPLLGIRQTFHSILTDKFGE